MNFLVRKLKKIHISLIFILVGIKQIPTFPSCKKLDIFCKVETFSNLYRNAMFMRNSKMHSIKGYLSFFAVTVPLKIYFSYFPCGKKVDVLML